MRVSLKMDNNKVSLRIGKRINSLAQPKLDQTVLKDSNYYAPMDEGFLRSSAINNSNIGSGELKWVTPYARAQYYGLPNKSKDKNPNAQMKWFEVAKSKNKEKWVRVANRAYNN